ncbi:hypothetical protein GCM10022224_104010 [Nonomuraea antimicrobica]|uniref:Uncharacterized protein n=1 Tax=Nonomuraea antimicrobica TaxID=561173 RepID=A0ABP7ENP4_9ACTN
MIMATTYQVVAPCVTNVPVSTGQGTQMATFYTNHLLPPSVPADRIKHLLSLGLIKAVEPAEEAKPSEAVKAAGPAAPPVTARSSKAELVAHGVARGDDAAELEKATREQLLARYVSKPDKQ